VYIRSLIELSSYTGTIIVPSNSCARVLQVALDQTERQKGSGTWRTADIVPWQSYLSRAFGKMLLTEGSKRTPTVDFVLSARQERVVWEAVIFQDSSTNLLAPEQAALLAQTAWHILHAWDIEIKTALSQPVSEDVAAFARWTKAYLERTAELRASDLSRLMVDPSIDLDIGHDLVTAHGFLDPAPTLKRAFDARRIETQHPRGLEIDSCSFVGRVFPDRETELYAAMTWASDVSLASPEARIVIAADRVTDDPDLFRRCVEDVFGYGDTSLKKTHVYLGCGPSLIERPPISVALHILEFSECSQWDAFSAVLRSPCISGAATERFERASFDNEIRSLDRYELPIAFVVNLLASSDYPCVRFKSILSRLVVLYRDAPKRQSLIQWLKHFEQCLKAAGWPGDGAPSAMTEGIVRQWADACDELQCLDAVLPLVSKTDAIRRLRHILSDMVVRGVPGDPRVFIVKPEQAWLLNPSHLWLVGADSDVFVSAAAPSALLPKELQRVAGVPGADARRDLYRARMFLAALARSAGSRVASYYAADGDLTIRPSPLVPELSSLKAQVGVPYVPDVWRRIREQANVSVLTECNGPALSSGTALNGGVAMLQTQAACPFQAFARHRLSASVVAEPQPGIDARHKGLIIHRTLAWLWAKLGDQSNLQALDKFERQRLIRSSITANFSPMPFETALERELHFIECERLVVLLELWMSQELSRPPFMVLATERPATVNFEGLEVGIRVDRIDRLEDGLDVIIDYKTGQCREVDWSTPRLNQPQLPFYALTFPDLQTHGIAFAKVNRTAPGWIDRIVGEEKDESAWTEQCRVWRADLASLVRGIRNGDARLDPKAGRQTCRHCNMHRLCRIAEVGAEQKPAGELDE